MSAPVDVLAVMHELGMPDAATMTSKQAEAYASLCAAIEDLNAQVHDHAEMLMNVRKAWNDKSTAEAQLARLRGYARLTPGMKDDQKRWAKALATAEATLSRVLGGPA